MKRISRLKELRALSNEEFDYQLKSFEFQFEMAYKYAVSTSSLSKEVQRRFDDLSLIGFSLANEEDLVSTNAWTGSKERYSYVEGGFMLNKSMRYGKFTNT